MRFFGIKVALQATLTAKVYKNRGWSVIPLLGSLDSTRAKLPAIKWGRYQYTLPDDLEIEDWFLWQGFGGLGIVLGSVSRLVVLDFDDPAKVSEFRHQYPYLTDTYTVESGVRRLPHYYYALPDRLNAVSRHVPGIDFRSDGTYVVAPPTAVDGAEWKLVRDAEPRVMTAADLRAIYGFMAATPSAQARISLNTPSRPIPALSEEHSNHRCAQDLVVAENRRNSDTSFDPVQVYRARLSSGRNNALFDAVLAARDHGWSEGDTRRILGGVHALQPHPDALQESVAARYAEALSTVRSAYSKPARAVAAAQSRDDKTVGIPTPDLSSGLSGNLREGLLQHGLAAAARVLDGLLMSGLRPGGYFTERQACTILSGYRIGRRTVMVALKSVLTDGMLLFAPDRNTPATPRTPAIAAIPVVDDETTKCDLVTRANRVKTPGRPPRSYLIPDINALALSLGVGIPTPSRDGVLSPDDLRSPAAYRRGLHRELLSRRPGQYSRRWLAERLGVSKWTCRRYEAKLNVQVQPLYSTHPITWTNLETLLPPTQSEVQPGTFLEADHKRYPPLRSIAIHLLSSRKQVFYRQQGANYYRLPTQSAALAAHSIGVGIPTPGMSQKDTSSENSHSLAQRDNPNPVLCGLNRPQGGVDQPPTPAPSSPIHQPPVEQVEQRCFWVCSQCMKSHIQIDQPQACSHCGSQEWECWSSLIWRDPYLLKLWWQRLWRDKHPSAPRRATPLVAQPNHRNSDTCPPDLSPADEAAAERARQKVSGLSRRTARLLVRQYGASAVGRAVAVVIRRNRVINPAGFLRTILQSEHLFYGSKELPASRGLESSQTWIQAMRESEYAEFIVNASDLVPAHES